MLAYASRARLTFGDVWNVRPTELLHVFRSARAAALQSSPFIQLNVKPKASGSIYVLRSPLLSPSYRVLPLSTFLSRGTEEDEDRVALLKAHVEKARTPRDRSTYRKRMKAQERMDLNGNLYCIKCGVFKTVESYAVKSASACGRQSYCKVCAGDWTREDNGFTLRRTMTEILSNAQSSAVKRSQQPFREAAGEFDLKVDNLLDKWREQEGRCAYSDVVISIERYTSWSLSLERCDNTLGYTQQNTLLVCKEFNTMDQSVRVNGNVQGSSKWSRHKVQSLPEFAHNSTPVDDFEFRKMFSTVKSARSRSHSFVREVAANGDLRCSSCDELKSPDDFYVRHPSPFGRQSQCKVCERTRVAEYERTTTGFFRRLLYSAKIAAKAQAAKGRSGAGEFRLEFQDVVQMYWQQRGLCFFSGVRMNLQPHSDWKASIERFDNRKGYILNNVVLICSEFQTCDHSLRSNIAVKGSAQWSREKARKLIQWLEHQKLILRGDVPFPHEI